MDSRIETVSLYVVMGAVAMPEFLGFMFTFTWLHSTYGYYPLCALESDGSVSTGFISDTAIEGFGGQVDHTCTKSSNCNSCCTPTSRRLTAADEGLTAADEVEEVFNRNVRQLAGQSVTSNGVTCYPSDETMCFQYCMEDNCGTLGDCGKKTCPAS